MFLLIFFASFIYIVQFMSKQKYTTLYHTPKKINLNSKEDIELLQKILRNIRLDDEKE